MGNNISLLIRFLQDFFIGGEKRPWGEFINLDVARVKILRLDPGQSLSLQYHHKRSELWVVLSGQPYISLGSFAKAYNPGSIIVIPAEETHQALATAEAAYILELSFGEFDESDIVRLRDLYNREKNT